VSNPEAWEIQDGYRHAFGSKPVKGGKRVDYGSADLPNPKTSASQSYDGGVS
jgi:hypothetical protein